MLNPKSFVHPEDDAALRNLEAIPGISLITRKLLKLGFEKLFHGTNMASKIRLSPTQLPEIYNRLPPICKKMGIAEPEFYLEMDPRPNAYTYGDTQVFIVVTSGLLEYLSDDEIDSVIAHECGHIACRHVLYHTIALLIMQGADRLGILGALTTPLEFAFLYWMRKSELSADRAAALVMGADEVVKTHVRLAGGPKSITGKINLEEWVKQADAYEEIYNSDAWNKTLQIVAIMKETHPFSAVRVREILRWAKTDQYTTLRKVLECGGDTRTACPKCSKQIKPDWAFCQHCGAKL